MNLLQQTLGQIATELPGATRVFHQHKLDFCCGGNELLEVVLTKKQLNIQEILAQLQTLPACFQHERHWHEEHYETLINHLLSRYHNQHRAQLPELIRLAKRVEKVHNTHPSCPQGLAAHLMSIEQKLESHMQKEEQILFPMLRRKAFQQAQSPIAVMVHEHDKHGRSLEQLMKLTQQLNLPSGACNTWQALYASIREFREDLMQHIHLESNILFNPAYLDWFVKGIRE